MRMSLKHPFMKKLLAIMLIGGAYWIFVSELKALLISFGLSRMGLIIVAFIFLVLAYKLLGSWFKY